MTSDVELERALAAVHATLNDQRLESKLRSLLTKLKVRGRGGFVPWSAVLGLVAIVLGFAPLLVRPLVALLGVVLL